MIRKMLKLSLFIIVLWLAACGSPAMITEPTVDKGNGSMGDADIPYDAQFIDSMIVHHQGAVTMAQQALEQSERPEILSLAEAIILAQETEITQMQTWRQAWYPDLSPTGGLHIGMGAMMVEEDESRSYDLRFIEAMILHHEGAIDMAQDALKNAKQSEIKDLAQAIISAQEAEIAQMKQWRLEWFGE